MHPLLRLYSTLRVLRFPIYALCLYLSAMCLGHPAVYIMALIIMTILCWASNPLTKDFFDISDNDITKRVLYMLLPIGIMQGYNTVVLMSYLYEFNWWVASNTLNRENLISVYKFFTASSVIATLINLAFYLEGRYRKLK